MRNKNAILLHSMLMLFLISSKFYVNSVFLILAQVFLKTELFPYSFT